MTKKHIVIDARIRRSSTGRYTDRLLEHLQDIDDFHRYTILTQPNDPWQPKHDAKNFKPLACKYKQFSFNPIEQVGFARQLHKLKPSLVHFTMTQQPLFYFGNIVTTTHDLTMFKYVRRGTTPKIIFQLKMLAYRFLFNWSHKKSKKIIVPTQYVAEDLAAYDTSTKDKIEVTHEASEPSLAQRSRRPTEVNEADDFIMYLGNAFPHKNLQKLVEAFKIISKSKPNLKLVLVGKKDIHYEELEQYVRDNNIANVIVTGFLPDEEAKWLYENCQAYVFPSLSEGFGLPGLEAMSHGAVLVSSNATCLPEVYGEAAHYFDPHNSKDIAKRILEVIDDELRQKVLRAAAKKQLTKFSWRSMAEKTLLVYKEILEPETNE